MNQIAQLLGVYPPGKTMSVVAFNRGDNWPHHLREMVRLPNVPFPMSDDDEDPDEFYLCLDEAEDVWTVVVYTDDAWRPLYDPENVRLDRLNDWCFRNWHIAERIVPQDLSEHAEE